MKFACWNWLLESQPCFASFFQDLPQDISWAWVSFPAPQGLWLGSAHELQVLKCCYRQGPQGGSTLPHTDLVNLCSWVVQESGVREKKCSQPTEKAQSLQNRSAKGAVLPRCGDPQEGGWRWDPSTRTRGGETRWLHKALLTQEDPQIFGWGGLPVAFEGPACIWRLCSHQEGRGAV